MCPSCCCPSQGVFCILEETEVPQWVFSAGRTFPYHQVPFLVNPFWALIMGVLAVCSYFWDFVAFFIRELLLLNSATSTSTIALEVRWNDNNMKEHNSEVDSNTQAGTVSLLPTEKMNRVIRIMASSWFQLKNGRASRNASLGLTRKVVVIISLVLSIVMVSSNHSVNVLTGKTVWQIHIPSFFTVKILEGLKQSWSSFLDSTSKSKAWSSTVFSRSLGQK